MNIPGHIVVDIEGTTTPVSFVGETLFPYASERLANFVKQHAHAPEVRAALDETRLLMRAPTAADEAVVAALIRWIHEDRKETPLKLLQGWIWRDGYLSGHLVAPIYDDVPACLRQWKDRGVKLHVYSSGSVEAQQLLFEHTNAGSLLDLFERNFDTRIGAKVHATSYQAIASELNARPSDCLFLTDSPAETAAADEAGWKVIRIDRSRAPTGAIVNEGHLVAPSFAAVNRWLGP